MKRAMVCGLVASTLLLALAPSREAWAQKHQRVVVEKFAGPGTLKFRTLLLAALKKRGVEVVAIEKVTTTEADLGLLQVSDNYEAVARELKVAAFFSGTISGKGRNVVARLRGTGSDGKSLGQASWTGKSMPKLYASVAATLPQKVSGMLSDARPPSGAAPSGEPATASSSGSRKERSVAAVEPEPEPEEEAAPPPRRSRRRAVVDADEEPPARRRAAKKEEDESVSTSDELDEEPRPSKRQKLDVALGAHIYRRDFTYNQNITGGQQAYKLPAVPAPTLSVDYFFLPNVGITAGGEYSIALVSQDANSNKFKTSSLGYFVGAKGRYFLSGGTELQGGVAYAVNSFKIVPGADVTNAPQVAGVVYQQVRVGVGARVPLGTTTALIGGANYLHLLNMGPIKDDYFPNATGRGGEGFVGVASALSWVKGLEGRVTLDLRRYVFTMNPNQGDDRVVGGATDQYIGLNLGVGYRN
jgi:hypothetical protein